MSVNYTFSDVQYTITEDDVISVETGGTATVIISPKAGYTVTASDFSLDPSFVNSYIQSVSFIQNGETVRCIATFTPGVVMPSSNVDITLCIIGDAALAPIRINGEVNATVGANITGNSSESKTPYVNSGETGETELLFTRTYTAATDYYLIEPTAGITTGDASLYTIEATRSFDPNDNTLLTSITYNVSYTYPNQSRSGDIFTFLVSALKKTVVQPVNITSYSDIPNVIARAGDSIPINIFGQLGAEFGLEMTNGTDTIVIAETGTAITSTGRHTSIIEFPEYTGTNPTQTWTLTLSGDLISPFAQLNPFTTVQYADIDITVTGESTKSLSGIVPSTIEFPPFISGPNLASENVEWNITTQYPEILVLKQRFDSSDIKELIFVSADVDGNQTNVTTLAIKNLELIKGTLEVGDKFGLNYNDDSPEFGKAPFDYEVTAVNSPTSIDVTPAITALDDDSITFFRTNGSFVSIERDNTNVLLDGDAPTQAATVSFSYSVDQTGDRDQTFTIDLDNIIGVIESIPCDGAGNAGGPGNEEFSLPMDPGGGLIVFGTRASAYPDKFEILHNPQVIQTGFGDEDVATVWTKVSTTAMTADATDPSGGNDGPFDNIYGTETRMVVPTRPEAEDVTQFIGTDSNFAGGTVPTRQAEFLAETGFSVPSMAITDDTGVTRTYQQLLWWNYTADDYNTSNQAILRVTGSEPNTAWNVVRICCPDGVVCLSQGQNTLDITNNIQGGQEGIAYEIVVDQPLTQFGTTGDPVSWTVTVNALGDYTFANGPGYIPSQTITGVFHANPHTETIELTGTLQLESSAELRLIQSVILPTGTLAKDAYTISVAEGLQGLNGNYVQPGTVGDPYTWTTTVTPKTGYQFTVGPTLSPTSPISDNFAANTIITEQEITGAIQPTSGAGTGIYGQFMHLPDDTQSGQQNVYLELASSSFGTGAGGSQQNRVATSIVTDATYNEFIFEAKVGPGGGSFTMNSVQIFAYSDSARTNLVTATTPWTGPLAMQPSAFQYPWGSLILPSAGTYFLKVSFNLNSSGSQSYRLRLT